MSLKLDKSAWKRVALRDVVRHVTDRVDPETSGLERFLAGEHIPSGDLAITSWGVIGEDPIGPMFYKRFKPGHVLYVSRRTYLRKVAVPDFEGITGEKTFVLDTIDPNVLLQEFLSFVLSAESFHAYAIANSRGSVNPYLNWGELAAYEFDLPPLDEQKRISDLLWSVERAWRAIRAERGDALAVAQKLRDDRLGSHPRSQTLGDYLTGITAGRSLSAAGSPARGDTFGVLKVSAVGPHGFVAAENKELLDQTAFMAEFAIRAGDLLITRANTSAYVGRPALVDVDCPNLMLSDKTLRLGVSPSKGSVEFLREFLLASRTRATIAEIATGTGAAMKNISQAQVRSLPAPDFSLTEQREFLAEAEGVAAAIRALDAEAESVRILRDSLSEAIIGGN